VRAVVSVLEQLYLYMERHLEAATSCARADVHERDRGAAFGVVVLMAHYVCPS